MWNYLALLVVAFLVFVYVLAWVTKRSATYAREGLEAARPSQVSLGIPVVNSGYRELGGDYMPKEMGFKPIYSA